MDVKILGTGCPKCRTLEQSVRNVVAKNNIDATITKVEDIVDIMNFGVMMTPALVIDGAIVLKGRVPNEEELTTLLKR